MTKRLMSFSKCRSVEVINYPARLRSIHKEVNYINYKQQQQQQQSSSSSSKLKRALRCDIDIRIKQ